MECVHMPIFLQIILSDGQNSIKIHQHGDIMYANYSVCLIMIVFLRL